MVHSLKFILLNWPRNVRPFCRPIFSEKKAMFFMPNEVRVHRNAASRCDLQRFRLFRLGWCQSTTGAMGREAQHWMHRAPLVELSGLGVSLFRGHRAVRWAIGAGGVDKVFCMCSTLFNKHVNKYHLNNIQNSSERLPIPTCLARARRRGASKICWTSSMGKPTMPYGNWRHKDQLMFFFGMRKKDVGSTRMNCNEIQ